MVLSCCICIEIWNLEMISYVKELIVDCDIWGYIEGVYFFYLFEEGECCLLSEM